MIYNLYIYLLHWLMNTLPKVDDTHIKCAQCGWESSAIRDIKFLYSGYGYVEGHCPECFGDSIYYKRDWSNLKSSPIDLKINIIIKDDLKMTYKLVDVKDNSMWLLDDEIVIVNRATPDTVYFNDGLGGVTEDVPLDFFLANAEFIEEDKSEYYEKVRVGDSWWCKYGRVDIEEFNGEYVCFYDDKGRYGEVPVERFLEEFVPYTDGMEHAIKGSLVIPHSGKKVGELLNDDVVVVIATGGSYKGGHTTKVRYELADFMDDEPPFMEILFVDRNDDVVYFTEDMSQPVYDLDGMYVVKGEIK